MAETLERPPQLLGFEVGGRRLAWKTGLLAGLVYALLPMAVFHERQALADPLLAMLTLLATLLARRVADRPRTWLALLMGLTLAGAYLVKISALLYMVVPILAVALFSRPSDRLKALAATLAGTPTPVTYPAMPVVVKTPAWPLVVAPPPPGVTGAWDITTLGTGLRALFTDTEGALRGFALGGDAGSEKQALAKQLPPLLA